MVGRDQPLGEANLRISTFTIAAAASLLAAGVAWAQPAATTSDNQNDPDRIVCKSGEPLVGSHLPGPRVCHTLKEWDTIAHQNQQNLENAQNKHLLTGVPGG